MEIILAATLTASLLFNLYLVINKKSTRKPLAQDARALLHDLTQGGAIVRITVIDPDGLMIYRSVK